jgi:DNA-binding winged helix-turn-helix (wHTH) protein/tetratricopeptide (TPR) repeat protein
LHQLRFDEFRLDPARRELWRGNELLSLPPKAFDCIAYLIEHRTRAVGRDELIAAVWGRIEVNDNLLDQVMLRARRILGDTEGERRMIRTVPRFGYAWVATTEVIDDARGTAVVPSDVDASPTIDRPVPTTPTSPTHRSRLRLGITVASVAVLLAATALWKWPHANRAAGSHIAPHTNIALLLPVTIEADAKYAWARLGAMELIADRLRGAGQAMVPSDNVIALVRDVHSDAPDAEQLQGFADTSGAGLVLQAKAALSAGYWRVTVQSLRGATPPLLAEGEARDLLEAAQIAADRTAQLLGRTPPRDGDLLSPRERALSGLLQQVEAAMLADQPETARALLDSLDAEQAGRAEVRYRRASIEFRSGHLDAAQAGFQSLLDSSSAADDPLFHARVLNGLGNIALRRDDYAAVERTADRVIALLGATTPSPELGRALTGRAIARSAQFKFDASVADFAQARVVLESAGDRLGIARVDANLGILEARRDRYAEALPLLDGGADQLANFHDLTSELFARVAAVYSRLALLDPAAALAGENRLRELVEREPNPQWKRYATLARADVLAANGRLVEARSVVQGVLDDSAKANDDALLGSARIVAARQSLARGDAADAARNAGEVLKTSWQAETPREQASAWLTLVRAQIALHEQEPASASVAAFAAWAERDGAPVVQLYVSLARAEQEIAAGAAAKADADFAAALAQADALRVPEDILHVCSAYAGSLLVRAELDRASPIAARAATWASQSYEAALLQVRLYHALAQTEPWRKALQHARHLAGERVVPAALEREPVPAAR